MEKLNHKMLESLVEIQKKINKLDFNQMLGFLVKQIIEILEVERCSIFRVHPPAETFYLLEGEPKGEHGIGLRFPFDTLPALKEVVEDKSYLLISEPWQDERTRPTRELICHKGINAILLVPVMAADEVVGIITIDATGEKKTFSQEEIHFCLTLSNLVGLLLERDLRIKEKQEKEALLILGRAAAEAAHRFRNPLVVIGGFARRLVKSLENSSYQEEALAIVEATKKLESIVNGLLRFVRSKKVRLTQVDINEILKTFDKLIPALTGDKNIKLNFQLDELPLIFADPVDIEDVFSALLRNAIEALEREGEITIKTKREENQVKISLTNSGGCIDEEIIREIFNPFFTTKPGGTGLGLAIAAATIRAYGGTIEVENDQLLKLTTFVVKLPY